MKAIVFLCFCLALAGTLNEVQGLKRRPIKPTRRRSPSPSHRPTLIGWRKPNGPCICKGPNPTGPHSARPTGNHGSHPTGHHGPHPTGHHGPYPTAHHSPHHTGHHSPHHTGHHSPPSGHHGPHPTGHHGPPPTGHHGPHSTGYHGHRPTGTRSPHHTGHHGSHPTGHRSPHYTGRPSPWRKGSWKRCVCRKRPEKISKIKFRMKKSWDKALSDTKSPVFKKLYILIIMKLKKVLNKAKRYTAMRFSQGSVIVEFGAVYEVTQNGSIAEDPQKALRNAISSGEMKDMGIYPDSLAVSQSYSGVKVSEWKASLHDCLKTCNRPSQMIPQTRTCTEIDASCDGIPLTNKTTCEVACPRHHARKGMHKGAKIFLIVGLVIGLAFLLAVAVVVFRLKKTNRKYMSTSPSTTSIKDLTQSDELQYQANIDELKFNSAKC